MSLRRTTLTAEADDLAVLAAEARRRGVSLASVLAETVAEKAARLRREQRPRFGVFDSGGASIAEEMDADPGGPAGRPWRS